MIDTHLYARYRRRFGDTFNAALWAMHPGETLNTLMREALAGKRAALSDESIASEVSEATKARLRR